MSIRVDLLSIELERFRTTRKKNIYRTLNVEIFAPRFMYRVVWVVVRVGYYLFSAIFLLKTNFYFYRRNNAQFSFQFVEIIIFNYHWQWDENFSSSFWNVAPVIWSKYTPPKERGNHPGEINFSVQERIFPVYETCKFSTRLIKRQDPSCTSHPSIITKILIDLRNCRHFRGVKNKLQLH